MNDLFGDKVERAIELLRMYQPKEGVFTSISGGHERPYYGCFSGGKDSCVIKEICRIGGINVVWHYNVTTLDPPELVRFIKKYHTDVVIDRAIMPFFDLAIKKKGFPTRSRAWCCEYYKERKSPDGSVNIIGVRAFESQSRSNNYKEFTVNTRTHQWIIAPILYWTDSEVWQFIKDKGIPYCSLYDEGFSRIGCIGCPKSSNREKELNRYPHFQRAWKRLFKALWDSRAGTISRNGDEWMGSRRFDTWEELYQWWLTDKGMPKESDECQGLLDFYS